MMKRKGETDMERFRKTGRLLITLMLMLSLTALAACSGGADGGSEESSGAKPETDTVRLAVFQHGHILNAIAEAQGYLEEEGIKVEYVPVETDTEIFEGIEKGTIDIASNSGTNLPLQMIADGKDLTMFGGYLLTGCMPVFAKVDTEWTGVESLVGKTMACEPNMFAVSGPLLDKGYDPLKDVNWYNPEDQNDRIKAVKEGKADFGLVGTQFNYVIDSDPELKVCTYASDLLPDYSCCRVEASTKWLNENPNTAKALLRAWIRAQAYYESNHEESVKFISEITGQDEAFLRSHMDNPHFDINTDPLKSSIERAWDYLGRIGLLSEEAKKIDIDDHINTELYKEALDECQKKYGKDNPKFYEKMQSEYSKFDQEDIVIETDETDD